MVIRMIQAFDFNFYTLIDPRASLSFVTSYASMNFNKSLKHLTKLFTISTPVGESILAKRVYRDCSFPSITRVP